jgi:ornithine cyclodeaminase/alanine dehydrogenase-like protein (mu-crystallin family)
MTCRLLTAHDVEQLLEGQDLVGLMESALAAFSAGEVVQPVRTSVLVGPERAVLGVMPAHIPARSALGSKLVTVFNGNSSRGLPSHFAIVLLFDDQTGALVAVMDGSHITEVRTAAVSAVAVRHLAAAPVRRLALFGCGAQARSHLRALAAVMPTLEEVQVWGPAGELRRFAGVMRSEVRAPIAEADSGEAAAAGADLCVLVTSSPVPVIERRWVAPGALVISVGACRRDHREMDAALVADARLFVDSRAAALVESGDIVQGIHEGRFTSSHIRGELGEAVAGRVRPRERDGEIVVFKSLGLAVEDVTVADLVYRRAVEMRVGADVSFAG